MDKIVYFIDHIYLFFRMYSMIGRVLWSLFLRKSTGLQYIQLLKTKEAKYRIFCERLKYTHVFFIKVLKLILEILRVVLYMNSTNTRARCIPCYQDEQSSSNFFQVSLIRPTKLIKPRTHLRCYNVLPTIVAFNHLQMHVLFGFPFGRASPFWLTYAEYFDHCTLRISSGVYHTIGFFSIWTTACTSCLWYAQSFSRLSSSVMRRMATWNYVERLEGTIASPRPR